MMINAHILMLLGLVILAGAMLAAAFVRRRILQPLADIRNGLHRLAQGRLDQTVTIRGRGEIARMGEMVNDIAANQQELLLHLWSQADQTIDLIDRISTTVQVGIDNGSRKRVQADLESLRYGMKQLQGLSRGVSFYNVRLEGGSAVIPDPSPTDPGTGADDSRSCKS